MRNEYNLNKLKVKRRGVIPGLKGTSNKIRITISLDQDIVEYFKAEAKHPGAFPYQTQINQALRKLIHNWDDGDSVKLDDLKTELLNDPTFIKQLAKHVLTK